MELIKGTSAINKAIASIQSRGAKLDASIQHVGLSVLQHIEDHGDYTLAERLVQAMPKGSRRLALVEWMLAHGRIALLDKADPADAERIKAGGVFKYAKEKATDIEGAALVQWFDMKKEKDVLEAFDVQAALNALLKRVAKMQAQGVRIEHADKIEALAKLAQ